MKAFIEIDRLRIRACHGVLPQERKVGNMFEISIRIEYPPALKSVSDDELEHTLNYAHLVELIKSVMAKPSNLLEHVAGRLHDAILNEYPQISGGSICVSKLAPPVSAEMTAARFILEF